VPVPRLSVPAPVTLARPEDGRHLALASHKKAGSEGRSDGCIYIQTTVRSDRGGDGIAKVSKSSSNLASAPCRASLSASLPSTWRAGVCRCFHRQGICQCPLQHHLPQTSPLPMSLCLTIRPSAPAFLPRLARAYRRKPSFGYSAH
jgi:hypothetical protein